MKTVYISIGNSDDKLSQARWCAFTNALHDLLVEMAEEVHGEWFSAPDAPYQNACTCVEVHEDDEDELKRELAELAARFDQDAIAWAEAPSTSFLGPVPVAVPEWVA